MNELFNTISWGVIAPLLVIQLILIVVALSSLFREERVNGPKWMWVLIILIVNILGPVLYFVFGRKND